MKPTDSQVARWLEEGRAALRDVAPARVVAAMAGLATPGPARARLVRGLIDATRAKLVNLTGHLASRASRVVTTIAGWARDFLDRLGSGVMGSAMAAVGTLEPTPADVAVAAGQLARQMEFLAKFRAALATGAVSLWALAPGAAGPPASPLVLHRSGMGV